MKALRIKRSTMNPPNHGLASTYGNWMCRCRPCTDAHNKMTTRNAKLRKARQKV